MKIRLLFIILLGILLSLSLTSCFDTSTDSNNNTDVSAANVIARQGMDLLNNEITRLNNTEPSPNMQSVLPTATYNVIKAKFTQALESDSDNPMANVGLAILDIVDLNYDNELWSLYEDVDSLSAGDKGFLNNQFGFLANSPTVLFKSFQMSRSNPLSIMRFQNFVKNSVIPRLDNAKQRLTNAINLAESDSILVNTGEENLVINAGEIYAFKAEVELFTAAFQMMTAYDWDMIDQQHSYQWITDMQNIIGQEYDSNDAFAYDISNDVLTIKYWDHDLNDADVKQQEKAAKILKYNIDSNPSFATLTSQSSLASAKANIQAAIQDVQDGMDHILAETGPQTNHVIKIQNILDMNSDIANHDPDAPQFMHDWNSVSDVVTWLQGIFNAPYTTTVNDVSVTIDVSAYFNGNLDDLRDVQPYSQWNNVSSSWIVNTLSWDYHWYNTSNYTFTYLGQEFTPIGTYHTIHFMYYDKTVEVGHLTNGPSGTEIGHDEQPYFPDYTFKGLFPGMTRAKLISLSD